MPIDGLDILFSPDYPQNQHLGKRKKPDTPSDGEMSVVSGARTKKFGKLEEEEERPAL